MHPPKKILLVCLDNMGDLVFTSGAYETVRRTYPHAEVGIWCKAYTKHVALLFPGRPKVFASDPFWDGAPGQRPGQFFSFIKTMWSIRREGYDCAIIASKHWRSALATLLTGIKERVGYAVGKNRWFLNHTLPQNDKPSVANISMLTSLIGCKSLVNHYELDGRRFLKATSIDGIETSGLIVLHPFAGSARRCWPLQQWVSFAHHLRHHGYRILWVGQPAELKNLSSMLTREQATELFDGEPRETSRSLSAVLVNAAYFIGHDSGPLHLAHSLGAKVLGLYLPGEPNRTFPQGLSKAIILHRKSPLLLEQHAVTAAFDELSKPSRTIANA